MSSTREMGRPDYAMIVGHGRSGTNWLLQLLDFSPQTFCRNEPNLMSTSPLARLPSPYVPGEDLSGLQSGWDEAVRWTGAHMGEGDQRPLPGPKDYLFGLSQRTWIVRTVNRRARGRLRWVVPSLGRDEWPLPWWLGSQKAMERAFLVMKIVQVPMWAAWVLSHRPGVQVLHIVRHPGGFVNSWRNRYVKSTDPERVKKENRERLEAIQRLQPEWGDQFGDIGAMSMLESELWYWRYASETIHNAGQGKPRYQLILYEDLVSHTLDHARRAYEECGLVWNDRIAQSILSSRSESESIAKAWTSKLSAEDSDVSLRVLSGSLMEHWWSNASVPQNVPGGGV